MSERTDNSTAIEDVGTLPTSEVPHRTSAQTGPVYWRSLDELADTPAFREFVDKEFPNYAPSMITGSTRRTFLKLMGASVALAGLTGCRRWPKRQLAPYAERPEGSTPGVPELYATAYEFNGVAKPLLVTAYDGRPVKVEGNPDHPDTSGGAADLFAQASILDLYDPDRAKAVTHRHGEGNSHAKSWGDFDNWLAKRIAEAKARRGAGLAVLCEPTSSDTLIALRNRLKQQLPQSQWVTFDPVADRNAVEGAKAAFGVAARSRYDLSKADVIVSFDSDLLCDHPDHVRLAGQFANGRRSVDTTGKMNRLYVAESGFTLTGGAADVRLPLAPADITGLVATIAAALGVEGARLNQPEGTAGFFSDVVNDLKKHPGRAVVIAGPTQPAAVHAMCHAINEKIGAIGNTVLLSEVEDNYADTLPEGLDTLIVLGGNPMYDGTPGLKRAIESAKHTAHLSLYDDETSHACEWHLPRAHYLEAWGDCRSFSGAYSVVQPLIMPLFGGRSAIELLGAALGLKETGRELVMGVAARVTGTEQDAIAREKAWRRVVHDGVYGAGFGHVDMPLKRDAAAKLSIPESKNGMVAVIRPDAKVYDGRYANNGWLQELPDPMTRITWDNTATISVPDSKELNIKHGDVVTVAANGAEVELPVYVLPGQPAGVVSLTLGYGRVNTGNVGRGIGGNCYPLRGDAWARVAAVTIKPTGKNIKLANTTDHHAIDSYMARQREYRVEHELIRSTTLKRWKKKQAKALPHGHAVALPVIVDGETRAAKGYNKDSQTVVPEGFSKDRGPQQFVNPLDTTSEMDDASPYQWGMTVDLNTCIGCGSCVVACQAENNIPIVGRSQVIMNREMHWLRVDRYYTGDPADPASVSTATQPMMCVHCETAPCEQVCPVAATVHDHEGLNVMVYNRCIGTRYCSNNCPYKVRRFNYFDWNARDPRIEGSAPPFLGVPDQEQQVNVGQVERMKFNPQVTVRMRGVMEKCTYCVQRIQQAKHDAYINDRQVGGDEIKTACQQTCPTHSIVFGNLKDRSSTVAKTQATNDRAYGVLDHLNLRPRTKYLAKITNPAHEPDHDHHDGH